MGRRIRTNLDQDLKLSLDDFAKNSLSGLIRMTSDHMTYGERFNDWRTGELYTDEKTGQIMRRSTGDPYSTTSDKQFLDKYKYQYQAIRRTGASQFGESVGYHFYPVLGSMIGSMALGPIMPGDHKLLQFLKFQPVSSGWKFTSAGAFAASGAKILEESVKFNVKYTTLGNFFMDRTAHSMRMPEDDKFLFQGNLEQMPWFQELAEKP